MHLMLISYTVFYRMLFMIRVEVFDVNTDEVLEIYEKDELLTEYQLEYDLIDNDIAARMIYIASKKHRDDANWFRVYYNNKEIYIMQTKGYMIAVHGIDRENENAWRGYLNKVLRLPDDF